MKKFMIMILAAGMFMVAANVVFAAADDKGAVSSLTRVTVPNVIGKSLTEAMNILNAAGLKRETQLSDRDGERRIVVRQDPVAGTKVVPGSVVKIYGQLASAQPPAQNVDDKGRVNIPRK